MLHWFRSLLVGKQSETYIRRIAREELRKELGLSLDTPVVRGSAYSELARKAGRSKPAGLGGAAEFQEEGYETV